MAVPEVQHHGWLATTGELPALLMALVGVGSRHRSSDPVLGHDSMTERALPSSAVQAAAGANPHYQRCPGQESRHAAVLAPRWTVLVLLA